jgi:hypothetical protein
MSDQSATPERDDIPSHYLDPKQLSDEELERELTINVDADEESGDPQRLDYYDRLLRERAERRARQGS